MKKIVRSALALLLAADVMLAAPGLLGRNAEAAGTPPFSAETSVSGDTARVSLRTSAAMEYASLEVKLSGGLPAGIALAGVADGADVGDFGASESATIGETNGFYAILNEYETVSVPEGKELAVFTFDISAAPGGTYEITFVFSAAADIHGSPYAWQKGTVTAEITKEPGGSGGVLPEAWPIGFTVTGKGTAELGKRSAYAGEKVTLTAEPEDGFKTEVSVTGPDGAVSVTADGAAYSFVMPDGPVAVSVVFSGPEEPYTDVPETAWYYGDVYAARDLGLMEGIGNGLFAPGNTLTVAEAVTLASRARSIYLRDGEAFVRHDEWYRAYGEYAMESGIIAEEPADWSAPASRSFCAALFVAAMPEEALKEINRVEDGAIPDVADDAAVYVLYRAGVMVGDAAHRFHPDDAIMRCEIAAVVNRLLRPETRLRVELRVSEQDGETPVVRPPDGEITDPVIPPIVPNGD